MLKTECIPCQYGDHDGHHEVVQAVPEGMLGGAMCPCRGECRERTPLAVDYGDWADDETAAFFWRSP